MYEAKWKHKPLFDSYVALETNLKVKIPQKVSCFVWLVIRRACLTHEVLQRRGIWICPSCYMCGQEAEVNGHLILHYKTTTNLWNMFLHILRVNWIRCSTTSEVLVHWQEIGNQGSKEDWCKGIPACIWWTLRKERNKRYYKGKASNIQKIKMRCLSPLYFWCKQYTVGR